MKFGTVVGLGPGHIVLDGGPALPQKGHSPQFSACLAKRLDGLRCHLVWRQASSQATVLDGDPAPSAPRKRGAQPANFRPVSIVAKWPIDQDATWYGGRPQSRRYYIRWGPSSLKKGGTAPAQSSAQFSAHAYCGQTVAHLSYC